MKRYFVEFNARSFFFNLIVGLILAVVAVIVILSFV